MHKHWSVDEAKFKKNHPEKYKIWRLTYNINGGLERGEKLNRKEVKKYWSQIKNEIDPYRKRLIEYLLWGKLYSLPNNISYWTWPPKTS